MHFSLTLLALTAALTSVFALPTVPIPDDGSWAPGKYEGPGTPYDNGQWTEDKYPTKRADDGAWYPGKYEGPNTPYDDGSWSKEKYPTKRADDGSWQPGKYEGGNTGYDSGKWE
ncbi:hypothetical protein CLAFUW4_01812 [Fulvia fulva]|uniref:Uncharacterized protein n=1 Tax=Passalora fulva TaxID=5499 RepID=A0A9Q8P3I7_PASFU|nr:uncharacterized protein CLAFUR5_01808 [Fulvia fulva]KAK4636013.1 hypothetical protein CLAFUR4_01810 [Fulvia fulva]KAK4637017.1 hypothetical protein CLAFUR0_01812 [Fulvia fulva]UJO12075.1 hypothetical protein CLAFUR5_01808 [Fulvia fulva]WPV08926.1 hypothetical protein CLAFUW4_01812 [Fulvia fulva]WPV23163.1 hypothetical protein CLAFUW7_01813 [Fulvia fulva]